MGISFSYNKYRIRLDEVEDCIQNARCIGMQNLIVHTYVASIRRIILGKRVNGYSALPSVRLQQRSCPESSSYAVTHEDYARARRAPDRQIH
jgi:hypothetical protein